MRLVGLLLILGAGISLGLHYLGAPEDLYHWLYDHLLSGLEVPDQPSEGSVDAVGYVSLIGGILELVAGLTVLAIDGLRRRSAGYSAIPAAAKASARSRIMSRRTTRSPRKVQTWK